MADTEQLANALEEVVKEMVEEVVDEKLDGIEVDADNVDGLENLIESKMEGMTVDADNVSGLERVIERTIKETNLEVDAGEVDGLEDFVDSQFRRYLEEMNWEELIEGTVSSLVEEALRKRRARVWTALLAPFRFLWGWVRKMAGAGNPFRN